MNFRKIFFIALIVVCASILMTACMNTSMDNSAGRNTAQPTVIPTPNFMPDTTNNAGNTSENAGGALGVFDWANNAATIEKDINQISEIGESRVVVTGTTALVGVKFTAAYKGEMTERIREMVAAEVKKADPGIQTVAVTSDEEDVAKVYAIADQVRAGRTMDELSARINEIVRNATTLR